MKKEIIKTSNESVIIYQSIKAARIAARMFARHGAKRANAFYHPIKLKSGDYKRDKSGAIIVKPAVYLMR